MCISTNNCVYNKRKKCLNVKKKKKKKNEKNSFVAWRPICAAFQFDLRRFIRTRKFARK